MSERLSFVGRTVPGSQISIGRSPTFSTEHGAVRKSAARPPIIGLTKRKALDTQRRLTVGYVAAVELGFQITPPGQIYINAADKVVANTAEDCTRDLAEHLCADMRLGLSPKEATQVAAEYAQRRGHSVAATAALMNEVEQNMAEISGVPPTTVKPSPNIDRASNTTLQTRPSRSRALFFDRHAYADLLQSHPIEQFQTTFGAHEWLEKVRQSTFIPLKAAISMTNHAFKTDIAAEDHDKYLLSTNKYAIIGPKRRAS